MKVENDKMAVFERELLLEVPTFTSMTMGGKVYLKYHKFSLSSWTLPP